MKKVQDYLAHAAECRNMARTVSSFDHRQQIEKMADTWEQLADARKRKLERLGLTEADEEVEQSPG